MSSIQDLPISDRALETRLGLVVIRVIETRLSRESSVPMYRIGFSGPRLPNLDLYLTDQFWVDNPTPERAADRAVQAILAWINQVDAERDQVRDQILEL